MHTVLRFINEYSCEGRSRKVGSQWERELQWRKSWKTIELGAVKLESVTLGSSVFTNTLLFSVYTIFISDNLMFKFINKKSVKIKTRDNARHKKKMQTDIKFFYSHFSVSACIKKTSYINKKWSLKFNVIAIKSEQISSIKKYKAQIQLLWHTCYL